MEVKHSADEKLDLRAKNSEAGQEYVLNVSSSKF